MGGRGSQFDSVKISLDGSPGGGEVIPIHVFGMTPTDHGSRYTDERKTLAFIEEKKVNYDKEQLQIIDDYGYVTKAYQGGSHSVSFDQEAIVYMKDKVVTHNHPSDWGGTFSQPDLQSLNYQMKEMRASAKEGTYVIRKQKGADPVGLNKAYVDAAGELDEKMTSIAQKLANKKWSSKKHFHYVNRKMQLNVIHEWYEQNASKYGYEYTFEKREG